MLRLYVLRLDFWFDGFNVLDFIFVTSDLSLNLLRLFANKASPFVLMYRLSKLARTMKAFRTFPELRKMMIRLVTTFKATFGRAMLVIATLLLWSIVAVQFLHPLNMKIAESGEYAGCDRCTAAYATVQNVFFMFCLQILTPESWGPYIKPVIEHFPMSIIFFAAVFSTVTVLMLNVVLGLVSDVASRLQEDIEDDIEDELLSDRVEVQRHIRELYKLLGKDEFHIIQGEMDIEEQDLKLLWAILDVDSSGFGRRQAPHAFLAESILLDWGMDNVFEIGEHLRI